MSATLPDLLLRHQRMLTGFVRNHGSGLLRFESDEDLVQGVHHRALEGADRFEYRGDEEFRAWITRLARAYIADRHEYWSALKRNRGQLLRLTWGGTGSGDPAAVRMPPGSLTGPATRAQKREQLTLAVKVLAALPPRDQKLVRWMSRGVPLAEQAERLGVGQETAQRAAHRAMERFRSAFKLLLQRSGL